ncbi:MAG: Cobalt/magnesium transport protein CorA [Chlamydiia bacterium]|nr:Cobalt/magnesium transport protein CorA [Chlamydiia bacterium]
MVKYYYKDNEKKLFSAIEQVKAKCWVHLDNAKTSTLKNLAKTMNLDVDDLSDSLDLMEIPRVEKIDQNKFIVFTRFPNMEETGIYTSPLTLVITPDNIITITPTKCELINKILHGTEGYKPNKHTEILVDVLLKLIQSYTMVIKKIRTEVVLHEKDLTKVNEKDITSLTHNEENLNQCLNALQPLKKVIEDLLTGRYVTLEEDDHDNLEDLLLASEQAEVLCELSLRIITSLRNSVQVVITNEFNGTIKLLTALTIILNLPTTIASIYGMNVPLPFAQSDYAFTIVMSFIVISFIGSFYFFQRRRWL